MKLLCEQSHDSKVVKSDDKNYYIEGIFMQCDLENRNGRIYPLENVQGEIERYISEKVNTNRATGELGHPDSPSIIPANISHRIVELRRDGSDWIGKALILDTFMGRNVKGLIDGGVGLGVSCRGLGEIREHNGRKIVTKEYELVTAADIVTDPSAPDAYMQAIREGREWVFEGGAYQLIDTHKKIIDNTPSRKLDETVERLFEEYMRKMFSIRH
jgi:hypothetical protein